MYEVNESGRIEKASLLADTKPAENLDTDRARSFVSSVMKQGERKSVPSKISFFRRYRFVCFGATATLALAAIALFVIITAPGTGDYGTPASLSEDSYVHASSASVDTALSNHSDSLTVNGEVEK